MSETDHLRVTTVWQRVPMDAPMERGLWNAFCVWEPSDQTLRLITEANRSLFAELVSVRDDRKCRSIERPIAVRTSQNAPKSLAAIVVQFMAENFDGGLEPYELSCCQRRHFGSALNTNLHLLKTIDLENETYWRRVVWCCATDPLSYYQHDANPTVNWKRLGIERRLELLFEQQDPRYWDLEALEQTVEKSAQYVKEISIEQLLPFPTVAPLEEYESYTIHNAPDAICHHGSLTILGHLENLTSLSLVFGVKNWTEAYRNQYSRFSLADMENLGMGLKKLANLKSFKLSHTQMDSVKLTVLLQNLGHLPLVAIGLGYCQLRVGCGAILGRFLSRFGPSLKHLDLSGNRLDALELERLCPGLSIYQGVVDRLDLSYNPIGASGVLIVGGAIKETLQVSELNFTGCPMGAEGSFRIIQLMSFHAPLRKVTMNCVPISLEGQRKLIQVLQENMQIEDVQVRECGLSKQTQASVRQIIFANARRRLKRTSMMVETNL